MILSSIPLATGPSLLPRRKYPMWGALMLSATSRYFSRGIILSHSPSKFSRWGPTGNATVTPYSVAKSGWYSAIPQTCRPGNGLSQSNFQSLPRRLPSARRNPVAPASDAILERCRSERKFRSTNACPDSTFRTHPPGALTTIGGTSWSVRPWRCASAITRRTPSKPSTCTPSPAVKSR